MDVGDNLFRSLLRKYRRGKLSRDNIVALAKLYGMSDDKINAILANGNWHTDKCSLPTEGEGVKHVVKSTAVWDNVGRRVVSQRKPVRTKHRASMPRRKDIHTMALPKAVQALLSDSKDTADVVTLVTCKAVNAVNGKSCRNRNGLVNGLCWRHRDKTSPAMPNVKPILPATTATTPVNTTANVVTDDVLTLLARMESNGISADYAGEVIAKLVSLESPVNPTSTAPVNVTAHKPETAVKETPTRQFAHAIAIQTADSFTVSKSKGKRPRWDTNGAGQTVYHVYGLDTPTDVGIYASKADAKADGLNNVQETPLVYYPRPDSNANTYKFAVGPGKHNVYTAYVNKSRADDTIGPIDDESVVYAAW